MAQHWRRVLYPHSPFGPVARVQQHTRGTKPLPVAPITDPLFRGFGIPNQFPVPLVQRAGRVHPLPIFAGSPWRERDLARSVRHGWPAIQGKKIRESNPTRPIVPHGRTLRRRRVVFLFTPVKNPPVPAYNVAAGHSRRGHLRVSDAGGSRGSYRNCRASAVAEGTPFPEGPPESSVGGAPGWHLSSSARAGLLPGSASVFFVISVRAYPPLLEGPE